MNRQNSSPNFAFFTYPVTVWSGSMAGEGREEAVTGKMAAHRLTMGHLISFGLEMDRCGHGSGLEWIVTP